MDSEQKYIDNIDYVYTEINTEYVYKDCALLSELDDYLKIFGLKRKEIKINANRTILNRADWNINKKMLADFVNDFDNV